MKYEPGHFDGDGCTFPTPGHFAVDDAEQLAILDEGGRVHREPGDTEAAAAVSMRAHAKPLRELVLDLLRLHPDGLTDDEGASYLVVRFPRADRLTWGRRRQELCLAGLVVDSGRRRDTPSGRRAIVWRAV